MTSGEARPVWDLPRTAPEAALETALGVTLRAGGLLRQALTHRSYAFEAGGIPHNERLEFLGDAVLGLVVADEIYAALPDAAEGRLAKIRAAAVNTASLARLARGAGVGAAVRLGVGEEQSGGRNKESILADTLEALLGAVYLDQGMDMAAEVIRRLCGPLLEDLVARRDSLDHKTSLQELTAAELGVLPLYDVSERGPDHAKEFTAEVRVDGERLGAGTGRSKKEAEQAAAAVAYEVLARRFGRGGTAELASG